MQPSDPQFGHRSGARREMGMVAGKKRRGEERKMRHGVTNMRERSRSKKESVAKTDGRAA